jgi:hypothetical protein
MRRLTALLVVLLLLLTSAVAFAAAERSLVLIRSAGEDGPSFSGAGVELAAEVPGGYLAFLDAAAIARLAAWQVEHVVIAADDPGTDVLVQYAVHPGDRHTELPADAEALHREPGFTVYRLTHDEERLLSCLPDVQRVFRRPLRFVDTVWEEPPAAATREIDAGIQAMVDTVDPVWLEAQVQTLEDFGTRHSQYAGGELASYWIRDQFFSYGYFDVTLHDYNSWNDNVVCVKPGSAFPDKYVVIGGHYDSTTSNPSVAPGADDNATGTATVLAAARALADYDFEYSVVFIAFSGEEQGLVGSDAWASEAAADGLDVVGVIAVDMVGYRQAGDTADIDIITNGASQPIRELVDVAVADYVPDHAAVTGSLPFGASSDHASFWSAGFRAVLFFEDTGDYSPYIHSSSDVVGTSANDFEFMDRNVRTAIATLALMARPFRIAISHQPLPHSAELGPFPVTCEILAAEPLDPATLQLHYRSDGSPFATAALAPTGQPGEYAAEIPAQPAGALVEYYLEAGDQLGRTATDPAGAPDELHAFRTGVVTVFADDVETDQGWTLGAVGDDATTGLWIWADPVGTEYQPEDDHTPDPGHLCFVTGNGAPGGGNGDQDVDGGHTTLLSPVFDLEGNTWAEISYWRYYVVATTLDDVFTVDISSDGGSTWTNLETVTGTEGWTRASFELDGSTVPLTAQMQLRFIAEDTGGGSLIEALIDDVSILSDGVVVLGAEDAPPAVARLGAHPNPFNPQTTLGYALPRAGWAELRVFDARGREVARPLSGQRPAGPGEVLWNAQGLASGVYLVQLSLDGAVQRGTKLTLVR